MNLLNTLWVILSSILVLFMVGGLALFYAGMVSARNALNTLKMNFIALAIIPLIWWFIGASLAFSGSNPFVGDFHLMMFKNTSVQHIIPGVGIPLLAFLLFHMMFATISPAVISGAGVERMSFNLYCIFIALWSLCVYTTLAHWIWSDHGWLRNIGALDFAGGIVVHVAAGVSALVLAIMLKPRKYLDQQKQHNIPYVILGTIFLWFGWFGFNGGSTLAVNGIMITVIENTVLSVSMSIIAWMIIERVRGAKVNSVGVSVACIIGLVAITPSAGYVSSQSAIIIGMITSIICNIAMKFQEKIKHKIDDALDVFVCHGLSGIIGAILTGFFASNSINKDAMNGLFYGGRWLLVAQFITVIVVVFYSSLGTYLIIKLLSLFMDIRVSEEHEKLGLDITEHGVNAYSITNHDFSKNYMIKHIAKKKIAYRMNTRLKFRK